MTFAVLVSAGAFNVVAALAYWLAA